MREGLTGLKALNVLVANTGDRCRIVVLLFAAAPWHDGNPTRIFGQPVSLAHRATGDMRQAPRGTFIRDRLGIRSRDKRLRGHPVTSAYRRLDNHAVLALAYPELPAL